MSSKSSAVSLCPLVGVVALLGCLYPDLSGSQPVIYVNTSSVVNDSSCWTKGEGGPCSTLDLGLQGLWNLSHQHANSALMIAPETYNLSFSNFTSFTNVSGLSILCYSDTPNLSHVTINCDSDNASNGVGFSFINSSNINIVGIVFLQCWTTQKSTSFNFDSSNPDFVQFSVGLYFANCRDVNFFHVGVKNTTGTGVAFYNTVGKNTIMNSSFSNNQFHDEGGGGVYIEFSYCDPQDPSNTLHCLQNGSSNVKPAYTTNSSFHFCNCTFYHNQANVSDFQNGTFILPHAQDHIAFGRGGGLSVFFKGKATGNNIVVERCVFKNNSALWGGGIFAEFQDSVSNNTFHVIGSFLAHNSLYYNDLQHEGTGGGGARVGFIYFDDFAAHSNTILFDNCYIESNVAYFGGGVSYYSARNYQNWTNTLWIKNCTFNNNMGPLGAAIDMSLWHPSINGTEPIPVVEDTLFLNNSAVHNSEQGSLTGMGVVYSDNMALQLKGSVVFLNNSGTALAVTGSHIEIIENSSLWFEGNRGRNGGGIAFLGNTYLMIKDNSTLYFINNTAEYYGGAIYSYQSGEHDLISSRSCFIRYYDITADPSEWDTYFYFEYNHANYKLNSIYASTLLPCIWGGPQGDAVVDQDLEKVFCWNKAIWVYETSNNCSQEISTAPYSCKMDDTYATIPGKTLEIRATVHDETHHDVADRAIFIARILEGNARFKGTEKLDYTYVSHRLIDLHGEPNSIVVIQMETIDPIVIRSKIYVTLQNCPAGYVKHSPSENDTDNSICVCLGTYHNYIVCDNKTFDTMISRTAWIGQVSNFSEYLAGISPYVNASADSALVNVTDIATNITKLNIYFCNDSNRTGILCGSCLDGYGVAVNSETFVCKLCPEDVVYYHWVFYILTEFLPVTIFFFAIFVLSMMVPFGPLNSYIFFAQVVTTVVKIDADGAIFLDSVTRNHSTALKEVYTVPYDVWNLNFFRAWLPQFCLSPSIHTLTMLSLGYVTALYPLLLLIIFVIIVSLYNRGLWLVVVVFRPLHRCMAQFRRWWNLRRSISGGIALFIVISYTKFNLVTFYLITPTPLYYADSSVATNVYYYEGNLEFGSSKTVVYLVIASVVLATFVVLPPLLLIIPSVMTFAVQFKWFKCLHRLHPYGKMQEFLDFFHGCFKDGTDGGVDCRYFAGLYFILRIILFSLYAGTATWELQYTAQMIFFLMWAFLFASLRPYKKDWINYVDMSMFLILAAVTTLSMYNLFLTRIHLPISAWAFAVQYVLIIVPLFYCTGYFIFHFCLARKEALRRLLRQERALDISGNQEESSGQLEESTGIQNFLDFTHTTGRLSGRMRLTDPHLWQTQRRSCRVPPPPATAASDNPEQRPLMSTSSDEQSDNEDGSHLSPVNHTNT